VGNYRTVIRNSLRAIGRALGRALGSGPAAGALVLSLLFFLDLAGASIEFMGFSADRHAYDVILNPSSWLGDYSQYVTDLVIRRKG